jgi:lincosamide nucleotidyltransferase A/C/D/E
MQANEVVELLKLFEKHHITVWVDGGWGVDALLEEQTRLHNDLDLALTHQDVPALRALLSKRGYTEVPRDDSWECNFVLRDAHGHEVDLHSCTFDSDGNNIFGVAYPFDSWTGNGVILGYPVKCIEPNWLVKFHTGYKLDENDYHDVKLLCKKFGLEISEEYAEFVKNEER